MTKPTFTLLARSCLFGLSLFALAGGTQADIPDDSTATAVQDQPSQPFMLGNSDIDSADISYSNPQTGSTLDTMATRTLIKRLSQTRAINQFDINEQLGLIHGELSADTFVVSNPYFPRYTANNLPLPQTRSIVRDGKEISNPEGYDDPRQGYTQDAKGMLSFYQQTEATRWFSEITSGTARSRQVCAIRFSDSAKKDYQLHTFASLEEATAAGWTVTHQYQCGTCSTLQDLAVYIGIPNQTAPISACTSQARGDFSRLAQVKQCIIEAVGFTEMCAETWAYNGVHTGANCRSACIAAKGKPLVVDFETGQLNSCLWCDEKLSGPGFKYSAGRTRRGSGLGSAIARPNDTLFYQADHSVYFSGQE